MIDLVKALRVRAQWETSTGITEPQEHIDWMAADEITRLRGQVEALNNERNRLWEEKLKDKPLREEIARLREAVKNAYYEGWQDSARREYSRQEIYSDWETSEARAAIREGGKE